MAASTDAKWFVASVVSMSHSPFGAGAAIGTHQVTGSVLATIELSGGFGGGPHLPHRRAQLKHLAVGDTGGNARNFEVVLILA